MKTKIIAEIGANHMGDMKIAEAMVKALAAAGVDIVKFQSWRADKLKKDFPDYAAVFERHGRTQLSDDDHRALIKLCGECGVEFLTTCFDVERADFLATLRLNRIKVASPDSTSFKLIDKLLKVFSHVIISTGMTTDAEVMKTVEHVKGANVTFMHCVSAYPAPLELSNLKRMEWLKSLGVRVGFSDHSRGTEAAKMAIVMGAEFIEKHFTLSRLLPGKDQAMSTEIDEFVELVRWAKLAPTMYGTDHPGLSEEEKKLRAVYIGKWGDNK